MNAIQLIEQKYGSKHKVNFRAGDTVKVHVKIKEGEKERVQIFEGVVIKIHNAGMRTSLTVRKISYGVGVERVFPLHSPSVNKLELISSGKVRRAKLYYMRERFGRQARIETIERDDSLAQGTTQAEPAQSEPTNP